MTNKSFLKIWQVEIRPNIRVTRVGERMKQNYFLHDGNKYESGTLIVINYFSYMAGRCYDETGKFLYYDTDEQKYYVEIIGKQYSYTEESFRKSFRKIRGEIVYHQVCVDKTHKTRTFSDEFKIKDLKIAWFLYIFAMLISVVFYERILAWIFVSLVFFSYRSKTLKAHGYK